MKIIHLESLDKLDSKTSLALGFFDGIHVGHQRLIERAIYWAKNKNLASGLFTFRRHPIEVLHPGLCFPYLLTQEEKIKLGEKYGLDYYIDVDFTREFSILSPETFVENILFDKLQSLVLSVGRDYRYGFAAGGDVSLLKEVSIEHGVLVEVVENVATKYGKVSSTFIRESIMAGDVEAANISLGRWHTAFGPVVEGDKRGRKLGIPTANVAVSEMKVIPRPGVYCVFVFYEGKFFEGIAHFGERPTFDDYNYVSEIHLLDFNGDLYGENLRILFVDKIRDTIKFSNEDKMTVQIQVDICACKRIFKNISEEEFKKNINFWI